MFCILIPQTSFFPQHYPHPKHHQHWPSSFASLLTWPHRLVSDASFVITSPVHPQVRCYFHPSRVLNPRVHDRHHSPSYSSALPASLSPLLIYSLNCPPSMIFLTGVFVLVVSMTSHCAWNKTQISLAARMSAWAFLCSVAWRDCPGPYPLCSQCSRHLSASGSRLRPRAFPHRNIRWPSSHLLAKVQFFRSQLQYDTAQGSPCGRFFWPPWDKRSEIGPVSLLSVL